MRRVTHPWIGADEDALPRKQLSPPVLPEPPLSGAGGVDCDGCDPPDDEWSVHRDDLWQVRALRREISLPGTVMLSTVRHARGMQDLTTEEAAAFGVLCLRVTKALLARPAGAPGYGDGRVGRVHLHHWGDGGEHAHVWAFPRPLGYLDLRGSYLVEWAELLPQAPDEELLAAADDLRRRLAS
jgi:diadenosine tetraphosphate (Ap4A) HIT family hydrolase